jgi:exo-beta-1,3-glucanase (GH17 family)
MFRKLSTLILLALVFMPSHLFCASVSWGAEKPWIAIDSVPEIGGEDSVRGHVELEGNGNYNDYRISMALEVVRGGKIWGPKPTAAQPVVRIDANGGFLCNFVSGGDDRTAERLYVYLIPASFLPDENAELTEKASLDVIIIDRYEGKVDIRQKYPAALKHPARTKKLSMNYSPYTGTLSPEENSLISEEHIRRQLALIHPYADTVKIFGVTGELNKIYKIAKEEFHFRVIGGCWIDENTSNIKNELDTLISLADSGYIDVALVGSETIYRNDLSVDGLVKHIQYVRGKIKSNVPVGTADIPTAFLENPELAAACDVVGVNIYPFHSSIDVNTAVQNLSDVYKRVANAVSGKEVIVTETGWPSKGTPNDAAVPSGANSGKYFGEVYRFSRESDIEIVWFSAYSEPWKSTGAEDDYEAHFGLFTSDEMLKEQFEAVLGTIPDTPSDGDESSKTETPGGGCTAAPGMQGLAILSLCTLNRLFARKRLRKRRRT